MSELVLLQAARLKGRLDAEAAAACAGMDPAAAQAGLDALVDAGDAKAVGGGVRITPQGRERLDALLAEERATVDQPALTGLYEEFDAFNGELKAIVTDWQMVDEQTPNAHTDRAYDQAVISRLADLHGRFAPLMARIAAAAPRLAPYPERFAAAIGKVREGDHAFVARPIADSYHTVWFELHEELIGLLGLSRAAEAAAGRAV
ncbi:hypothetical protein F8568_023050 [Actinomadura sp. LD22]|uniref:Uncharacterized protein n=1 Tax=Actinomadura physcomitrii TaxID=2650748 RepID=A0A6I4MHP4_9ACTN|nr:hypothetical protein [Actinomadura physcomitrii]MWA03201.1 hypothetical protein [Actinomadura physcomitrii]